MNAHQALETLLNLSFRTKTAIVLLTFSVFFTAAMVVYQAGIRAGDLRATVRYTAKEAEFQKKNAALETKVQNFESDAAVHLESDRKLSLENSLLKQQQQLQARISTERDAAVRLDQTASLTNIFKQKEKQLYEIENLDDFDANVCALCDDINGKGANRKLSDGFCGKCAVSR